MKTQKPKGRGLLDIWTRSNSRLRLAGILLIILAIGSSLQIVWTNQVRRDLIECQATFMNMTVQSIEVRSKTNAQANDALEELISGLTKPRDDERTRELYGEYLKIREEQKKTQAENPYPTFTVEDMCQR